MLSVARKFAMHINRWNTRLCREQGSDVGDVRYPLGDTTTTMRRHSDPFRSTCVWLRIRAHLRELESDKDVCIRVVVRRSADMHAVDKVQTCMLWIKCGHVNEPLHADV